MFKTHNTFDSLILKLEDPVIIKLIQESPLDAFAKALLGCGEKAKNKVFDALSDSGQDSLIDEIKDLSKTARKADIESAQEEITQIIHDLSE